MVKTEVGIYKKKTRKNAFDQESDQEKKKEITISTKKAIKKKRKNLLFSLVGFLVEIVFSFFFLTFFFINSHLRIGREQNMNITSTPIGAWKCNFPADQPTDRPTEEHGTRKVTLPRIKIVNEFKYFS